jgi:hypothetical protein
MLLMLFILINTQAWTLGQDKKDVSPQIKSEEYQKLVNEYRDLKERHKELLEEARNSDPSFQRAMDWLENERLEVSTPFAKEDKEFFSTLNNDDQKMYRDWQQSVAAKINIEVFEKEWKTHSGSHKALLFWAGMLLKRFSMDSDSNIPDNPIPEMKGLEESQWSVFLNYAKQRDAKKIENIPIVAEKFQIPKSLIGNFEKRVADTALFNVYDTYYRMNYPEEATKLEKEQTKIHNQLMAINPNWVHDEKLEFRNHNEYQRYQLVPVVWSPFSWILMGTGVVLIVIVIVRIYQRRRYIND